MYSLQAMITILPDTDLAQNHNVARELYIRALSEYGFNDTRTKALQAQEALFYAELVRRLEVTGNLNHSSSILGL